MTDRKSKPKPKTENGTEEESTAIVLQSGQANLSRLPGPVQRALAGYEVKRKAGVEPLWPHETPTDYIIGTISGARNAGQFGSKIITIDAKVTGNENSGEWKAENIFYALWLTTDLETKLNAEEDGLLGRHVFIRFDGWLTKEDNPALKNDMKLYTVQEFNPKQLEK